MPSNLRPGLDAADVRVDDLLTSVAAAGYSDPPYAKLG
jgi:hypothetical protein